MTHKWLHTFAFIFVLSLSAHMGHEVSVHEDAVCEVCIQGKSLEDGLAAAEPNSNLYVFQTNHFNAQWTSAFLITNQQSVDSIRGPPVLSIS